MTTVAALSVTSAPLAAAAEPVVATPTLVTKTFTSTASLQSWTVPGPASSNVQLMITASGGQGGQGGYDGSGFGLVGGYVGVVSGTISVAGGTSIQISVGAGGAGGQSGVTNKGNAAGGTSKISGKYAGGKGGVTGPTGTSGAGGGGGAATVIRIGGDDIVAGGAGGGGGSGNKSNTGTLIRGRTPAASFDSAHPAANTNGGTGTSVTDSTKKDGGSGGGGGGGAIGGAGGTIEFGVGDTTEWFGYGGYPGKNSTAGYSGLTGSYQWYTGSTPTDTKKDGRSGGAGSVTIKYVDGPPAAPRSVIGRTGAAEGSVDLKWDAPVNSGLTEVTEYVVQYRADGAWIDADDVTPTVTSTGGKATVTGLVNGSTYTFRVAAKNGYSQDDGKGAWSTTSAAVAAAGAPTAIPDSPWLSDGDVPNADKAHVVPGDGTIGIVWDDDGHGGTTAPSEYTLHVYDGDGEDVPGSPKACSSDGDCTIGGLDPSKEYTAAIETPGTVTDPVEGVGPYQPPAHSNTQTPNWAENTPGAGATVTRDSDGNIAVTWPEGGAPADSYELRITDSDGNNPQTIQCNSGGPCTASPLDPNQQYSVDVVIPAVGQQGDQEYVPEQTSGAVPVLPYAPTPNNSYSGDDLTVTRNPDGGITATPSSIPSSDYLLHIYDDDGDEIVNSPVSCVGGSACTSGYLDPDSTYGVAIEVPNRTEKSDPVPPTVGGDRSWSEPQDSASSVKTPAPTGLSATELDGALSIAFSAPTAVPAGNAILYYEYSLDGGAWANSGAFASPVTISGLTNGTPYGVQLRAVTLQGTGTESATASGTPKGYPTAPYGSPNPAGISLISKTASSATVHWDSYLENGSTMTGYTLTAFSDPSVGTASSSCKVGGGANECTLPGLSANGTYYLSVQATNGVGASQRSDPRVKLVMNASAPGQPGTPSVSGGKLVWSKPGTGAPTDYEVRYSTDGGATWVTVRPSSLDTSGNPVTASIDSLPSGGQYTFQVRALVDALAGDWSDSGEITVKAPLMPILASPKSKSGGYTVQVTNYDGSLTWDVSSDKGSASIDGSGLVTVTGLTESQSATVTVKATAFGTGSRSASTSGTALGGTAPILSAATPTADGFTVQIVNWKVYKAGNYGKNTEFTPVVVANPNGVTPTFFGPSSTGLVTVTNIGDGHQITLAYKVKSDEHTETQSDSVVGKSLLAPVNPTVYGNLKPTSDGFMVQLKDYDPDDGTTTYGLSTTAGTVSGPDADGWVTVSGLNAGEEATLTITKTEDGHAEGSLPVSGQALQTGDTPLVQVKERTRTGFTAEVTNPEIFDGYDEDTLKATVMVSGGASVQCKDSDSPTVNGPVTCKLDDVFIVSGVASGASVKATVYVSDKSHGATPVEVTGQALYAGIAPEFGPTYRAAGAFGFQITNWSVYTTGSTYDHAHTTVEVSLDGTTWVGCTDAEFDGDLSGGSAYVSPIILCSNSGQVGVAGLGDGGGATVHVRVTESPAAHDVASAIRIGAAPDAADFANFGDVTSTNGGFTADIQNFVADDPNTSYVVFLVDGGSLPVGATVTCRNGLTWHKGDASPVTCPDPGHIDVNGLGDGVEATLRVLKTDDKGTPLNDTDDVVTSTDLTARSLHSAPTLALDATQLTRTAGGFQVPITDATYDDTGATSYAVTVTAIDGSTPIEGAQAARVGKWITVSGLSDGAWARVKLTATKTGYKSVDATQNGQAKGSGTAPKLALGQRTATGFVATIDNATDFNGYDSGSLMVTVMVTNGAEVSCTKNTTPVTNGPVVCNLTDTITVSGVAPGRQAALTASVIDKDHLDKTSDGLEGRAQFAGVAPEFGPVTRADGEFTTNISNWDTFKLSSLETLGTSAYVAADTTITVTTSAGTVTCAPVGEDSAGSGNTATCSGPQITVTGLGSAATATVTVTVTEEDSSSEHNHTDSYATRQGQALQKGDSPTFGDPVPLDKSFSIELTNYDAAASYTITAFQVAEGGSDGPAISPKNVKFDADDQLITVKGLADGQSARVKVHVAAAGKTPADASHDGSALKAAIAPIIAVTKNNANGFVVTILNWDLVKPDVYGTNERPATFTPTLIPQNGDSGLSVTGPNDHGEFTVTNVPTGHTASLALTLTQADHPPVTTAESVTGIALYDGVAPILGTPTRTADGFRVPITNYELYTADGEPTVEHDNNSKYGNAGQFAITVTGVSAGGTNKIDVETQVIDGVLHVSKLAYGQTATITVTGGDGLTKHQDETSDPVTGQALFAPVPATFGQATATTESVTVPIANFSASTSYTVVASPGVASRSGGVITVTGLKPGETTTITVIATPPGHVSATADVTATALKVPEQSGSSAPGQLDDGFTARIVPFDSAASYAAAISGAAGATVAISGDTVTVHGMAPGDTVTVTITVTKDGYAPTTITITYTLPADAGTEEDPSGGATPPEISELAPGESAVIVDGVPVPSKTRFGDRGVVVSWRGMTMTAVQLRDGKRVPPGADGTPDGIFTVPFTGSVRVDVSGFAPRTRVQLWAFSTPTLLGTFTVKRNANGVISVDLPEAVFVGDHTLVATGVNTAGEQVSMSTAMRVTPLDAGAGSGQQGSGSGLPGATTTEIIGREEMAYTGTHTLDELRIAASLLLAGMVMIAIGYRRKREDPSRALVGDAAGFGPTPPSDGSRIVAFGSWRRKVTATPARDAQAAALAAALVPANPVQASVSAALATVPNLANVAEVPGESALAEVVAEVLADVPAETRPASYRYLTPRREPSADWMHLVLSLGTATA